MKPHVRIYHFAFGYTPGEWIPCEVSAIDQSECKGNGTAVDIHHIDARGMGGSNEKDHPSNLMALCRECHEAYGDRRDYLDWLNAIHLAFSLTHLKK